MAEDKIAKPRAQLFVSPRFFSAHGWTLAQREGPGAICDDPHAGYGSIHAHWRVVVNRGLVSAPAFLRARASSLLGGRASGGGASPTRGAAGLS